MKKLLLVACLAAVTGCTYQIPPYAINSENTALVRGGMTKLKVVSQPPAFEDKGSIFCRAAGPVSLPEGQTFGGYVSDALRKELAEAGLLDEAGGKGLNLKLTRVDFESSLGNTNWYIDGHYEVAGKGFDVNTVYHDRSSYLADRACGNMATYFQKAVGLHISQLYKHPAFIEAVGARPAVMEGDDIKIRLEKLKQLHDEQAISDQEYEAGRKKILENL